MNTYDLQAGILVDQVTHEYISTESYGTYTDIIYNNLEDLISKLKGGDT